MSSDEMKEVHKKLTLQLKEYIPAIIERDGKYIPEERLNELKKYRRLW